MDVFRFLSPHVVLNAWLSNVLEQVDTTNFFIRFLWRRTFVQKICGHNLWRLIISNQIDLSMFHLKIKKKFLQEKKECFELIPHYLWKGGGLAFSITGLFDKLWDAILF